MTFQYLNKVERTKIPTPIAKKRIIFFKRSEDTKPNFIEHEDEVLEEEQVKVVFRAAGCCEAEASMSKSFKKKGVHRNFTVLESKIGKPRYSLRKDRRVKDQDCRGAKM